MPLENNDLEESTVHRKMVDQTELETQQAFMELALNPVNQHTAQKAYDQIQKTLLSLKEIADGGSDLDDLQNM